MFLIQNFNCYFLRQSWTSLVETVTYKITRLTSDCRFLVPHRNYPHTPLSRHIFCLVAHTRLCHKTTGGNHSHPVQPYLPRVESNQEYSPDPTFSVSKLPAETHPKRRCSTGLWYITVLQDTCPPVEHWGVCITQHARVSTSPEQPRWPARLCGVVG